MANKNPQKIPKKFFCEICDYHTSNKKDFTKHLLTAKHSRLTNANQKSPKIPKKSPDDNLFFCNCENSYKHLSSL